MTGNEFNPETEVIEEAEKLIDRLAEEGLTEHEKNFDKAMDEHIEQTKGPFNGDRYEQHYAHTEGTGKMFTSSEKPLHQDDFPKPQPGRRADSKAPRKLYFLGMSKNALRQETEKQYQTNIELKESMETLVAEAQKLLIVQERMMNDLKLQSQAIETLNLQLNQSRNENGELILDINRKTTQWIPWLISMPLITKLLLFVRNRHATAQNQPEPAPIKTDEPAGNPDAVHSDGKPVTEPI